MTEEKKAAPELVVLIMVPNYWGKGKTIKEAWKKVTEASYKTKREHLRGPYKVFVLPQTEEVPARVDEMGTINWADVDGMRYLIVDSNEG